MTATTFPPNQPEKKRSDGQFNLRLPPFLRDVRNIAIIVQIIFFFVAVTGVLYVGTNVRQSMIDKGFPPNFAFLSVQRAGFEIAEAPVWYTPDRVYGDAFIVGIINTIRIVVPGLFLSTVLGIAIGIALLSRNFMVKTVSSTYVEILRNTPLLVQLFFWYFVVMFGLPATDVTFPNEGVFVLPLRVLAYPILAISLFVLARRLRLPKNIVISVLLGLLVVEMAIGILGFGDTPALMVGILGVVLLGASIQNLVPSPYRGWAIGVGLVASAQLVGLVAVSGLVAVNILPANVIFWDVYPGLFVSRKGFILPEIGERGFLLPQKSGFRITAGAQYTPEYMALFVGLVIYTSAFIGEIVRAGIQAVPYGQIEASRALGLSGFQALRLIILPQALRVIIPPLTSQYLNLAKNSTLATAVAFSDAYSVGQTIMNQSGQGVTGFMLILLAYLAMSLIISVIMNVVNGRFQLVTR
jgi:general L-amino acid transport system permease protein